MLISPTPEALHPAPKAPETEELPRDIRLRWQAMVSLLRTLLDVPVAFVYCGSGPEADTVVISRDDSAPWPHDGAAARDMGINVAASGRPLVVEGIPSAHGHRKSPAASHGFAACLAEPLRRPDGGTYGALCVMDTAANSFAHRALVTEFRHTMETHLALMETRQALADEEQKADALAEQLARETHTDPLTGLLHRCTFADRFHQEIARHKRAHHPLSLILCNLDHFRQYNTAMGRTRGDTLLVTLAGLFKGRLRAHDLVWRWGGDEFLLLLPDTPLMGAVEVVESIRHIVEATTENEPDPRVTLSAGATNLAPEETQDACLNRCNSLLKAAKAKGRNCVILG
ncbi:GGDEF domain-containing protein [Desulfoluna butyratoxydans]|uniref:diguanylate cyclase n=1 Tax=Desulfoluna butyratoxydans TaxID=231438 RepID=A0A4U8YJ87_9BACT|nr:sensor domain-containing diguanylate cyclase [Desulfoluna butyratoxydans]VFQ43691.1 nucleotide cyclase [Desulfoluna butyratoxydans]